MGVRLVRVEGGPLADHGTLLEFEGVDEDSGATTWFVLDHRVGWEFAKILGRVGPFAVEVPEWLILRAELRLGCN